MMDARRKQVYTGFYRFEGGEMKVLKEQCAQSVEDTLDQLRKYNEPVIFLGDGVPVYHDEIRENQPFLHQHMQTVRERPQSVHWHRFTLHREFMKVQMNLYQII